MPVSMIFVIHFDFREFFSHSALICIQNRSVGVGNNGKKCIYKLRLATFLINK